MKKEILNQMARGEIENVLIIDDEIDVCYLLTGILKQSNFLSTCVNNLSDAEKALKKSHPSIIFLDNHLPDGLGVNFISKAKKIHPDTKIIMITAHDTVEDKKLAIDNGVDSFIGKPFTRNLVLSTLRELSI